MNELAPPQDQGLADIIWADVACVAAHSANFQGGGPDQWACWRGTHCRRFDAARALEYFLKCMIISGGLYILSVLFFLRIFAWSAPDGGSK